jgi:hypothetical protein
MEPEGVKKPPYRESDSTLYLRNPYVSGCHMVRRGLCAMLFLSVFFPVGALSKDPPAQVLVWPPSGAPVVRFTFGKFKGLGSSGSTHNYSIDTKVENLWDESPRLAFRFISLTKIR